ncbi:MAG: phosphatidate cytidylyltransferase [Gemmataceae bacterium]|nr:phosphatidate cytidylyltransferase [Gemmataceae bacterium]
MGAILIALAVGALWVDQRLAPWYPFLLVVVLGLALAACYEMLSLLDPARQPKAWVCYGAVAALVLSNWVPHLIGDRASMPPEVRSWPWLAGVFAGAVLVVFLEEMATFTEPGTSVTRMALAVWTVAYLGLLPCFLAQLRWLPDGADMAHRGSVALALAIFVPKMCDSGAYFAGRLLGRHRMAPVLSPKKTWEGAAGGMVAAVATAIGINQFGPALAGGIGTEIGFGLTVGVTGLLGDLAESLIKRDCQKKDASQIMPGFGGVLDVVDSIVFAAPVAYWWFL